MSPTVRPTFSGSVSKTAAMLIPCSAKIGDETIASPSRPAPTSSDVVLPLSAEDLADLAEQRVDVVADAALAELAERRQIAPDLGRVDVRVVRDLLRGDPALAHLLRLRQHLQVPAEPSRDADGQTIGRRDLAVELVTPHKDSCISAPLLASGVTKSALRTEFVRACAAARRAERSRRTPARRRSRRPESARDSAPRARHRPSMSPPRARTRARRGQQTTVSRARSHRWQPGRAVEPDLRV